MAQQAENKACAMTTAHAESMERRVRLTCRVNGQFVVEDIDPTMLLLHFLRDRLKLFGTKELAVKANVERVR